ncbi:unnamed protein product [Echinostoma caproni]|uniref:BPTI/Kunitz inhibitor domain-containing protein n=1 Tax=Echinostoma caproni TaxID=27848 RepID=A0A3P8L4E1_9TREM|nr:unnamed protein product [Echinostoma caproni]
MSNLMSEDRDTLLAHPPDEERCQAAPRTAFRSNRRRKIRRGWVACLVMTGFLMFLVMMLAASFTARIYLATASENMSPECKLPLDSGFGDQPVPLWGWTSKEGRCVQFTYQGQGGNANRFPDEKSCEQKCPPRVLV